MDKKVSDACQINDFDHMSSMLSPVRMVSDACQINDFDHPSPIGSLSMPVSDACQINDFDHPGFGDIVRGCGFRCLSDQ